MNRGDIYFANLDPTIGSEIKKTRPVLIISNNANNRGSLTITIIPITSNISKIHPFEVFLDEAVSGLSKKSKAQCHQIRTISKLRIQSNRTGRINSSTMTKIETSLKLHLGLS